MEAAQRILLVRPSALGDVCRTVPVLVSLSRAMPEAAIDWVVRDSFTDAVAAHPDLNEVIAFPRQRFASWWRNPAALRAMIGWQGALRTRRYDVVIDCQGLLRSGLMTAFTAAPVRIGHIDAREFAWLAYNERVRGEDLNHTVDRMLGLLQPLDIQPVADMRLYTTEADQSWWNRHRRSVRLDDGAPYAVLAPTARWPSKRWPIERWTQLVQPLRDMGYAACVIIGAPGEEPQVRELIDAGGDHVIDLVGKARVGQTMAVVEQASLLLANDSAPLHMAVGFDVPLVGLFGPTDPARVGPYGRDDAVLRKYEPHAGQTVHFKDDALGDALMRLIEVDDVLQRVRAVAEQSPSPNQPSINVSGATP